MQVKTCEICDKRAARYVCQECGREVCQFCFEINTWLCSDCYNRLKRETLVLESFPWTKPFKLFLFGFILMFVGIIVMMIATIFFGSPIGAGVIIWIPPFPPIGFGAGPYAFWAILIGVALAILGIVLFIVFQRQTR